MSMNRKVLESEKDMISSLPNDIIDTILVRLPLEEAINTSLLSRSWRYKWRTMSEVIIHHSSSFSNSQNLATKGNRFLLLHKGNILKFEYTGLDNCCEDDVSIWLDHLDGAHVQQLKLVMHRDYLIPSSVFSFQNMVTLKLNMAKIVLPSSFAGFQSLTTLILRYVKFDDGRGYTKLQELIHLCPLLKHLKLTVCFDDPTISVFELNAPNLHSFEFYGPFAYLRIKDTPLITNASLSRRDMVPYNLTNFLHGLSNVVQLNLSGYYPSVNCLCSVK